MPKMQGARSTTSIGRKITQSIFDAFDFANGMGFPLNRYVVINLRDTAQSSPERRFRRIRHKFRDWLAYHRNKGLHAMPPLYVMTRENPSGTHEHVNWVVHIPSALEGEFEVKLRGWVRKVQGEYAFDRHLQPVDADTAKRLAKYIVKGTDPTFLEHFYLTELFEQHGPQGTIYGDRARVSPALGRAIRKNAGYNRRAYRRGQWPLRDNRLLVSTAPPAGI